MSRHSRTRGSASARRRPGPFPALESPRDAGVSVRAARSSRRRTPPRWLPVVLTVLIIVAAGASIAVMAPRTASRAGASVASTWKAVVTTAASAAPVSQPPTPTPAFASFRGLKLHLPVAPARITVLAFHQTSYNDSYKMKPLVKIGTMAAAAAAKTKEKARQSDTTQPVNLWSGGLDETNAHGVWTGSALELWRNGRNVAQCTAIDCGAHPGTPVCSPVDGTVMEVRPYKLYGKYTDIEIDIKPDAWSDIDVVMLHVTDPTVAEGAHVLGGITPVAHVRKLSGLVPGLQLRTYSPDGGNHTHVQINKIPKPGQPWIVGQDAPGVVRIGS